MLVLMLPGINIIVGDIKQYPSNIDIKMEKYIGIALEFQGRHDK